jgi:hypothetical protein
MKKNVAGPNPGLIEKEYPYRYRWSSTLIMLIAFPLLGVGMLNSALKGEGWYWWIFSIFFIIFFICTLYILFVNLFGNRRLLITKKDLYLPVIWKSETYTQISFSDITEADLIELYGNVVLRIFVRRKEFNITHSWLPSIDMFNEIVQIVNERMKTPS